MTFLTDTLRAQLLANGRRQAAVRGTEAELDFPPVVKLFHPSRAATWLLTELDPEDPDIAFGLCDLGVGCPELGSVRLSELDAVRRPFGLGIERDLYFEVAGLLSAYADAAAAAGRIVETLAETSMTS